jgi:hypothetical protein
VRLGQIRNIGNGYPRKLLVVVDNTVLAHQAKRNDPLRAWARKLLETKPVKRVADTNKLARMVFASMPIMAAQCSAAREKSATFEMILKKFTLSIFTSQSSSLRAKPSLQRSPRPNTG